MAGTSYTSNSRYAHLHKESTWGTYNSSAELVVPILVGDDGISMTQNPGQNILETNTGSGRPFYYNGGINEVTGSLNTIIDETYGKDIIDWASVIATGDLTSYSIGVGGGLLSSGKRWLGCKVASMALTSGPDAGAQRLAAALTLQGKDYATTPSVAAESFSDYSAAVGYMHHQGTLTIGTDSGSADATVRDFSMTFTNNLDVGNGTGTYPQWITYTGRTVTCDVTILYADDKFINAFESANSITGPTSCRLQMVYKSGLQGESPLVGKTLTLDMLTNVVVTGFEVQNPLSGMALANMSFTALLDTSNGDNDFSVSEVAS